MISAGPGWHATRRASAAAGSDPDTLLLRALGSALAICGTAVGRAGLAQGDIDALDAAELLPRSIAAGRRRSAIRIQFLRNFTGTVARTTRPSKSSNSMDANQLV